MGSIVSELDRRDSGDVGYEELLTKVINTCLANCESQFERGYGFRREMPFGRAQQSQVGVGAKAESRGRHRF